MSRKKIDLALAAGTNYKIGTPHADPRSQYVDHNTAMLKARREGKARVVDVLEPHRTNEDDTFAKAKGLAEFAETHGSSFGKLMMLKVEGVGEKAVILGFDVNDPSTRKKALKLRSNEDVQGLFRPLTA